MHTLITALSLIAGTGYALILFGESWRSLSIGCALILVSVAVLVFIIVTGG